MYKGYEKSQFSINISFNLENDTRYRPMFDNNFSKCGPIFKILSPIRKKILYVQTTRFPSHLQYVDTLPCEIRKSKNVIPIFTLNVTILKFNL